MGSCTRLAQTHAHPDTRPSGIFQHGPVADREPQRRSYDGHGYEDGLEGPVEQYCNCFRRGDALPRASRSVCVAYVGEGQDTEAEW